MEKLDITLSNQYYGKKDYTIVGTLSTSVNNYSEAVDIIEETKNKMEELMKIISATDCIEMEITSDFKIGENTVRIKVAATLDE